MSDDNSIKLADEFPNMNTEAATLAYGAAADGVFSTMHALMADELLIRIKRKTLARIILDVGTGLGNLANEVKKRFSDADVYALDISEETLAFAKSHHRFSEGIKLVAGDVLRLPFPSDSIDVVTSFGSVHHWGNREAGIREILRALSRKNGSGLAFIVDLRRDAKPEIVDKIASALAPETKHAFLESVRESLAPEDVKALIKKAGAKDFEVATDPFSMRAIALNARALRTGTLHIRPGDILWGAFISVG